MLRGKILGLLAGIFALGVAVGAYEFHVRHVAAAAAIAQPAQLPQGNLRQLMQSRVHEEYTYLSFTIWHDQPLTAEKMDSIAASSGRIMGLAHDLTAYEPVYKQQGWSQEDIQFFDDKRLQLTQVAEELKKAAQKHDSSGITNFFIHLDSTCQGCHRRFRPDLSWT
jgi:cytochrome c556